MSVPNNVLSEPIKWKDPALFPLLNDLQGNILKGHGRDHTINHFLTFSRGNSEELKIILRAIGTQTTSALRQLREADDFKIFDRGGGTNVSAPLARLNAERASVDTVVIVSDNESWIDPTRRGATATMNEWTKLKGRNPAAKLICIDIQPYGFTQAKDRADIMNVGGFTDAVFDAMARFASGQSRDWVEIVQNTEV